MATPSYITIFLLVFSAGLFSQSLDFQFDRITSENGLSNNSVYCILQDSRGFMWFGTYDGLNRYDGYTFKIFKNDPADSTSLSNNTVWSILEDSSGYIWVGTNEGLNKYNRDTEKFTHYLNDTTNSRSISNNLINIVYEDKNGTIWIGTGNGLNRYNRTTDDFTRFFFEGFVDSTRFYWNNNCITVLAEDHNGQLLIGTTDDFIRFDPETGAKSVIPDYAPYHPVGDWWPVMSDIYQDRTGLYWIGLLLDGVATFDSRTGNARLYAHDSNDSNSFSADFSHSIYEDQSGLIWIASNDGLNIFDRKTEKFTVLRQSSSNRYSLSSNEIWVVFGDRQGNIWIGTKDMGINKLSRWKKPFKHYIHNSEDPSSLPSGEVHAICEDRTGNIWIGSYGGGLSCLNTATGNFNNYRLRLGLHFSDFSMVSDVLEDRFGNIWSCFFGINCLDPRTGTMKYFWHEYSNTESHSDTWTFRVHEDRQGILWFGTFGSGLERFNREKETFTHLKNEEDNPQSLASNDVYTIYQDTYDYLWIGTGNGLCKMMQSDKDNIHFKRYQNDPKIPNSITGSTVYAIFEDKKNRFWIGTNGGLNRMDREKETFSVLTETDGLPCNDIYGVLEDDHGFLWLRTKRGLVKYHPETQFIRTYDERDGLTFCKSIVDGFHAFCRGKKGEIYYGGANSIAVFHPDSLRDNPDPPILVLTGFRIHNQPIEINAKSPLQKSITETEVIKLSYNQNMISFDFAAIDYTSPERNQHAYQMEGVDQDWIYCGNQHTASYTNLDPGEYVFRVKGANNDGIWNEEGTAVKIIITPPWWRTNWAYAFYLLLFTGAIATTWHLQMRRLRVRNELKMKKYEAQKLKEVDHLKSRFFANISHEFRTPLTLILGPINTLLAKFSDAELHQELTIMQRNARRLHRLINQLLELSKIEAGNMKLQAQPTNMVTLLNRIVQSFESQAKLKNIELKFAATEPGIDLYVDREKIENIFYNLLSNALKFTPKGGQVSIYISHSMGEQSFMPTNPSVPPLVRGGIKGGVKITVSNTGSFIPADRIDKIFERFYQIDDSYTREHEGSGIGLALTKELVTLHHGEIQVQSSGRGLDAMTTFTVMLPTGKDHLQEDEIIGDVSLATKHSSEDSITKIKALDENASPFQTSELQSQKSYKITHISPITKSFPSPVSGFLAPVSGMRSPLILIVEDNADLRTYMRSNLQHDYCIYEAQDGAEGLKMALDKFPDLIISDVMMPIMDGFKLCQKLKTDERTSHIPVILLTARAEAMDKISGLETGADDYLTKPFDTKELQVRIKNLIEQRRKLREKFNRDIFLQPKEFACSSYDERFLQRAMEIIEQHLEDPDFKIATLTKEIGMSRKQLYRKIHALTNQSANRFIRSLRLKRAADLLQKKYGNVAEVSYKVGFNNPSYFAECFRKQFGTLPSEYGKS